MLKCGSCASSRCRTIGIKFLNALHRTNAVEIRAHAENEDTRPLFSDADKLSSHLSSVEAALSSLSKEIEDYQKENKIKSDVLKDGFFITYEEFVSAKENAEKTEATVARVNALTDEKNSLKNELAKARKEVANATLYAGLQVPFSAFCDTAKTHGKLGVVPAQQAENCLAKLAEIELCAVETLAQTAEETLLFVACHKSVAAETDGALSSFGFAACPHTGDETGEDTYRRLCAQVETLEKRLAETVAALLAMENEVRSLKIYADYLAFEKEKELQADKLRGTETTFFLEAYVPAFACETVEEEIRSVTPSFFLEFSNPSPEDEPPTLLRNNAVVESFEGITNMYSPPNYREFDPNAVMSVFYSLFMGFIIGDMGYGLLMAIVGGFIWWKNLKRPTGMSRLAGAFAFGGIFAVLIGALFNSFFGVGILPYTVMPNPQDGRCSFIGIEVPSVLVIALVVGIVHLCVGYVCKAVQCFMRKQIVDGIFDGIAWAVFSIGTAVAIVGLVEFRKYPEINLSFLAPIGGVTAGVSLAIAVLAAARNGKGFTRFTKSFGAAYGVINYASDILSYARLYGLMLSGAVVAQIISNAAIDFFASGNVLLIALAIVLLVAGHAFNLVMNLLGAYIHDARLQYVEFYGRFFEGEGELFTPLGSQLKYVNVTPTRANG